MPETCPTVYRGRSSSSNGNNGTVIHSLAQTTSKGRGPGAKDAPGPQGDALPSGSDLRQGGGHEAQAPLADVERGPAVVVRAGVPVGDDHLRERQPVGDWAQPPGVVEPDLVQDQALPLVEANPQLPVLP